ncbi:MAG: hypothetical protein JKY56_01890 [Kofleriaceae bacterium]|nr:hypothetical protein [Kofleriaceae bacterium]
MSILFSCICNQAKRIHSAIAAVETALKQEGVTRWGLSYSQSQEVLLSRHPRAIRGEFDFFSALAGLESEYLLGVAATDTDYSGNANTQPFRYKHWMFALESTFQNFPVAQAELEKLLPDFLRQSVKGKTPAELLFHIFLAELHREGQLQDHNVTTDAIATSLRKALTRAQEVIDRTGIDGQVGNLMVSNSRSLLCVRLAGPLFLRQLRYLEDEKRPDTEFRSVLTIGAEENPGEGFEELPQHTILKIGRDLNTDREAW